MLGKRGNRGLQIGARLGGATLVVLGAIAAAGLAQSCNVFGGVTFVPDAGGAGGGKDAGDPDGGIPEGTHYLDATTAAKLCAMFADCGEPEFIQSVVNGTAVPVDAYNFSTCMTWLAGPIAEGHPGFSLQQQTFECMSKASSCDTALDCLFVKDYSSSDEECADGGTGESCSADGKAAIHCDSLAQLNCDTPSYPPGTTCLIGDDGSSWCAAGKNCDVDTTCDGTILDYCGAPSNLHFRVDCAMTGQTCGLDPASDQLQCLTDGKVDNCTGFATSCVVDGNAQRVRVCNGVQAATFDCSAIKRACVEANSEARCAGPNDECTPFDDDVNTCSGATLAVCIGGVKASVDCASIGKKCAGADGAAVCK